MTFDSCQGEERDIIYYSMVEREDQDNLKYIFPVDFRRGSKEKSESLKAQRLNVGLSRTKESMRFVVSKDIEDIKGEIGNALRKYKSYLDEPDDLKLLEEVDSNSPMEKKVLDYIFKTPFYQNNKHRIEIKPQFNIGNYIKQIDNYAKIPSYKVDFLLIFKEKEGKEKCIIVEYDGFEYHFKNKDIVDKYNYQDNYIESDVERQKTIELYGYRFIRFNKFNLGEDPIKTIDTRLKKIFKNDLSDDVVDTVNGHYEKIENKEEKVCPKCGQVKPIKAFHDSSLKTGVGRHCMTCKS